MELLTGLVEWIVTLTNGSEVTVWASSFGARGGCHVFDVLAQVPSADQDGLRVTGGTPSDPEQVLVAVASIPSADFEGVLSA